MSRDYDELALGCHLLRSDEIEVCYDKAVALCWSVPLEQPVVEPEVLDPWDWNGY